MLQSCWLHFVQTKNCRMKLEKCKKMESSETINNWKKTSNKSRELSFTEMLHFIEDEPRL